MDTKLFGMRFPYHLFVDTIVPTPPAEQAHWAANEWVKRRLKGVDPSDVVIAELFCDDEEVTAEVLIKA